MKRDIRQLILESHAYALRWGLIEEDDLFWSALPQPNMPGFTACFLCAGVILNYVCISDSVASGSVGSSFAWFLRLVFIPPLFCYAMINLYLTCIMDPGVANRSKFMEGSEAQEGRTLISSVSTEGEGDAEAPLQNMSKDKDSLVRDRDRSKAVPGMKAFVYDHCNTCDIDLYTDSSISHCNTCGCCIVDLDHHCPWMGQCIGKRNWKVFVAFNSSWLILLSELLFLVFCL